MRFVTLFALPLALTATPAFAQAPGADPEVPSTHVSLRHLDLTSPKDQRRAYARVDAAARSLCSVGGEHTLYEVEAAERCNAAALVSGRAAVERAIAAAQGRAPMVASANASAAGTR